MLNCALMLFTYITMVFFICRAFKDISIVDIFWGLGFMVMAFFCHAQGFITQRSTLILILVVIWSLRLSLQIALRKIGKPEDPRYEQLKGSKGLWGIYFSIFLTQAGALYIIGYPIIFIHAFDYETPLNLLDWAGVFLWATGLLCETVADIQLYYFLKDPQNKGKILDHGLWHYSRHPNYFGEMCIWWGIFLITLNLPYSFICIISPLFITYLLVFVSGIPPAEAQLEKNPDFRGYQEKTSILIPWFPKK